MTALAIAAMFVLTLGYVLWPVFRPGSPPASASARADAEPARDPLPLEQLEPPARER